MSKVWKPQTQHPQTLHSDLQALHAKTLQSWQAVLTPLATAVAGLTSATLSCPTYLRFKRLGAGIAMVGRRGEEGHQLVVVERCVPFAIVKFGPTTSSMASWPMASSVLSAMKTRRCCCRPARSYAQPWTRDSTDRFGHQIRTPLSVFRRAPGKPGRSPMTVSE